MSIERMNKHGLPIIDVYVKKIKKSEKNVYFCSIEKCLNRAEVVMDNGKKVCIDCYVKSIDYGNHAFD